MAVTDERTDPERPDDRWVVASVGLYANHLRLPLQTDNHTSTAAHISYKPYAQSTSTVNDH